MDNEISLSEAWEVIAGYDSAVWYGVFAAVATFIIEIMLCKNGIIFASGDKKIAKAKKAGNVITATVTTCRYKDRFPDNKTANRMYIAMYEYSINGVSRTKQVVSTSVKPPRTISLYYTTTPNKVISEYDIGKNPLQFLLYLVPVLVAYFVMEALGFNG